jgi:hypothetical protein
MASLAYCIKSKSPKKDFQHVTDTIGKKRETLGELESVDAVLLDLARERFEIVAQIEAKLGLSSDKSVTPNKPENIATLPNQNDANTQKSEATAKNNGVMGEYSRDEGKKGKAETETGRNGEQFGHYDENIPRGGESKVNGIIRSVSRMSDRPAITSGELLDNWIQENANGESGVLLTDTQRRPVSFIPMTVADMQKLRTGDKGAGASLILGEIEKTNAIYAAVISTRTVAEKMLDNPVLFLDAHNIPVFDTARAGKSDNQSVILKILGKDSLGSARYGKTSPDAFYSTTESQTTGTTLAELTTDQRKVVDNLADIGNTQIISHETALRKLERAGEDISVFGPTNKPQGFFLNGKVFIIPENAKEGSLWGLFRHEVGVHVGKLLQSATGFKNLLQSIEARKNDTGRTGEAIRAAMALVPANTGLRSGETYDTLTPSRKAEVDALRTEEVLAYMVRDAKEVGIVRRFISMVKRALVKMGIDPKIFSVDDLSALADMAVRREAKATGNESLQVGYAKYSQAQIVAHAKAFFSKLQQVTSDKFTGMKAQGVENFLLKQGVKKTEIEATGVREWLAAMMPTDKVTREQLADFVRANTVAFEDVVLGEPSDPPPIIEKGGLFWASDGKGNPAFGGWDTREEAEENIKTHKFVSKTPGFAQYTEPGAEPGSYREMFVTAPGQESTKKKLDTVSRDDIAVEKYGSPYAELSEEQQISVNRDFYARDETLPPEQRSSTWQDGHSEYQDIKNPIVRIRFNEVTDTEGRKILRIEEMQGPSPENQAKMPSYLKDNIYQAGVKRILAYAKENGFDGVALATKPGMSAGETQADRYSLEKQIKSLDYEKTDINGEEDAVLLTMTDLSGDEHKEIFPTRKLESVVGKEIARKIIDSDTATGTISGVDLKVGGEGLKKLYDNDLPNIFKAWGGAAMGETKLQIGGHAVNVEGTVNGESHENIEVYRPKQYTTMPFIPISDKTASSFPMFAQSSPFQEVTAKILNSPAFKAWFGKSVVKQTVYHGSPTFGQGANFTFDPNRATGKTSSPGRGLGSFFTENKSEAMGYAGQKGTVTPLRIRIENPLELNSWDLPQFNTVEEAQAFRKRKQLQGYDGIHIKDEGHWVVFEANQAKSAESNTGEFSRTNNDIRYAVASQRPFTQSIPRALSFAHRIAQQYDLSARAEKALIYLGDKDAAISRVQKEIGPQPERFDYNLIRRLTGKKTADELKIFEKERRNPLLQEIADAKLNIADVDQLGWAQHAPERNLQMKRVNAKQYIDRFLNQFSDTERLGHDDALGLIQDDVVMNDRTRNERRDQYVSLMDSLAAEVIDTEQEQRTAIEDQQSELDNREASRRLDERLKIATKWEDVKDRLSGMTDEESEKVISRWKQDKRFDKLQAIVEKTRAIGSDALKMNYEAGELTKEEYDAIRNTYQFHVPLYRDGNEDTKSATGKAGVGPLASPVKLASGSTKEVANVFSHVMDRYQSAVMRKHKLEAGRVLYDMVTNNPDDERWSIGQLGKKPYQDNEGNIRFYPDQQLDEKTETYVKVDGVKHIISINKDNPGMIRWMEALNREVTPLGPILRASQKITRTLAQLNTSFSPEFLLGNFMRDIQTAMVNMNDSQAKGMQKTVLKGIKGAIVGIYKEESGKESGEWGKIFREFSKNGGKIGWMQSYDDISDLSSDLEKELSYLKGERPKRDKLRKVLKWIETANGSVENGVRLATYKALINSNVSPRKAAHIVSNLTVDFTRHGTAGPAMNSLWMFANAGIQGNIRIIKAIATSKTVQKITGGIAGFGFAASMIGAFLGGDDDDGESYYDKLKRTSPYIFERNMVFMIPGTNGKYIKIPMPYGYNMFYVIGDEIASVLRKGKGNTAIESGTRISSAFMNALNPLSSGTLLQTLSPTVTDPLAMIAENKDFTGKPLMPEKNPFGVEKPDSERYFKSVNPIAKAATEMVNNLTGGSRVKSGLIDVSPETVEMFVGTLSGSLGKIIKDTIAVPMILAKDGSIESHKVPFARRFIGTKSESENKTIYMQNKKDIDQFIIEYKNALPEERLALQQDQKYKIVPITIQTDRALTHLRKIENKLTKQNKDDQVKIVKERMKEIENRYNRAYNRIMM